ncbi:CdaR family protein [Thermincola potens]|uniref:YbbR family protein n=1 Tax=Thermincola potens (strain JR) TaxID=635013 RepID=D5XAG4_THEPJ|nr:CdaR family protein [Thermincola potens]ADG81263.1 YbbR family protein [Thermincola potens JR]
MSRVKGKYWSQIVSLLLAVILWIYVSNEINPTTEQILNRVPLETRGLSANVAILEMPRAVDLRIQGPREKVQQVGIRAVEAYIDLSNAKTGEVSLPVRVAVPEGVTVVDISPREVTVRLEKVFEKQVPIRLKQTGKPARGYRLLDPVFDPVRVIIKGPGSLLNKVESAIVQVNFTGSKDGFHGKMPVQAVDKNGNVLDSNLVSIFPSRVEVFVPVVLDMPSRVVPVKPVLEGQPAPGYIVSNIVPELATVSVFGRADLVRSIDQVSTAPLNIAGANADIYQEAALVLPPGLKASAVTVKVLVKIVPENQ